MAKKKNAITVDTNGLSNVLKRFFESDEFQNAHELTKVVLNDTLKALDKQGFIKDADFGNLFLLCSALTLSYSMRDEILERGFTYLNSKQNIVTNPLVNSMSSQMRLAQGILEKLGASTHARKILTNSTSAEEESPLEQMFNGKMDDDLVDF